MNSAAVYASNLHVVIDGREIIGGVSLSVSWGEVLLILGPNGVGKTTLLKALMGLLPRKGRIHISGEPSMVPQNDMLLPWMTLEENIALPLLARGVPKEEALKSAREAGRLLGLTEYLSYYPGQVSGGTRRKASIARALATRSRILFLDEPYTGLDINAIVDLQGTLQYLKSEGVAMILVSHQLAEAAELADKAIVLSGRPARVVAELDLSGLSYEERVKSLRKAVYESFRAARLSD